MHSSESASEFVVGDVYQYDTRSPARWIISHLLRYKWYIVAFLIGAFCNGAGAATIPTLVGIAFNTILAPQPDLNIIAGLAVTAFVSQTLRAVLQFMRNASAEVLGQRM